MRRSVAVAGLAAFAACGSGGHLIGAGAFPGAPVEPGALTGMLGDLDSVNPPGMGDGMGLPGGAAGPFGGERSMPAPGNDVGSQQRQSVVDWEMMQQQQQQQQEAPRRGFGSGDGDTMRFRETRAPTVQAAQDALKSARKNELVEQAMEGLEGQVDESQGQQEQLADQMQQARETQEMSKAGGGLDKKFQNELAERTAALQEEIGAKQQEEKAREGQLNAAKQQVEAAAEQQAANEAAQFADLTPEQIMAADKMDRQQQFMSSLTPQAIASAEVELSSVFSSVIGSVLTNMLTEEPELVRKHMGIPVAGVKQRRRRR